MGCRRQPAGPGPARRAASSPVTRWASTSSRPTLLRWIVAYAAIHRAGAVAVPLNPQLTRPEVERMVEHCGAGAVFAEESLLDRYDGGRPALVVAVPAAGSGARPGADRGPTRRAGDRQRGGVVVRGPRRRPPATSRRHGSRATWPTSSTPRAPPGIPRRWPSATTTPRSSPSASRRGTAGAGCTPARPTPSPGSPSCTRR